jgi:hypothetical protein
MDNGYGTVMLKGEEVQIALPSSFAVRWDIVGAAAGNPQRAAAAALGVCWTGPRRPKARLEAVQFRVLEYGGLIFDELIGRGCAAGEVWAAGSKAMGLISSTLATEPEVAATEGFSEPTGSST